METIATVPVLADRLSEALDALNKLAKKARRYGNPDIEVSVGERRLEVRWVRDWDNVERKVKVEVVDLLITGEAPKYGKHEFLARVEIDAEHGNIVDTVPGVKDLDKKFRHTNGYCDHCRTLRARNDVFVVRDLESGEQLQIGRTCLRDYMGIDNPENVARRFKFLRDIRDVGEDNSWGGSYHWAQSVEGILGLTATCVRLFGWCSKGQAQYDDDLTPTVSYVFLALRPPADLSRHERPLYDRIHEEHNEDDRGTAAETIRWVREEMGDESDYEHNLKTLLSRDVIADPNRLGIVVSAVAAFHRAKERELRRTREREVAQASVHLGEVGERLRGLKVTLVDQRVVGSNDFGDTVLVKFRDEQGNLLSWFTGRGSGLENGEQCLLDGTVKQHSEYNGAKETQLTRCKIHEL